MSGRDQREGADTSGVDEPNRLSEDVTQRWGRLLGRAVGVGTILALAGCSRDGDRSTGASANPTSVPGGRPVSPESVDDQPPSGSPTPPAGDGSLPAVETPTPASALSEAECADRLPELRSQLEEANARNERLMERSFTVQLDRDNLRIRRDIWTPAPADVVASARDVGERAREAVVFLAMDDGHSGTGSGWFIDETHVATNGHNVVHHGEDLRPITAWTLDGTAHETTVVDRDDTNMPDVAILEIDGTAPATLPVGSTDGLAEGDQLVQVGHPGGIGNWIVTLGAFLRESMVEDPDTGESVRDLYSTVPGRSGVSGSPVLDLDGTVVGMTHAAQQIGTRQPGEEPPVAPDVVFDRAITPKVKGNHVPIELVEDRYEEWI